MTAHTSSVSDSSADPSATGADASYRRITRVARRLVRVDTAALGWMDGAATWYTAVHGQALPPESAGAAFIERVVRAEQPVVIANVEAADGIPRSPSRNGGSRVRFMAGVPLRRQEADRRGALLLFDAAPRTLDEGDVAALADLAAMAASTYPSVPGAAGEASDAHRAALATISDNISEGIFRSVPGKGLVYVNKACARMFGYDRPEDMLRMAPQDLYVDAAQRDAVVRQLDTEGVFDQQAFAFRRRDGSTFWALVSGRVTYDENGAVRYRDGAIVDVTERMEMERQLRESEERWQRLVTNHPDAVFISVGGRFRYANPAGARLFGASSVDQLIGHSVFDFVTDEVGARLRDRIQTLEAGRATPTIEHRIRRFDGAERFIEVTSVPIIYGGETAAQTVARDITERRAAEQQLRAAEAQFRGLVEQSLVGIYIVQEGQFVYVNPALAQTLGYTPDELTESVSVQDVVHPDDWPTVRHNLEQRYRGEVDQVTYTFRIRRPDGTGRHVEVHGTRTEHEGQPAVIGTLLDITERIDWERQLMAAKEKAEEMNRLKSAFLANMSHEIRTPLTSIIGFADLIGSSPESAGEFARLIQRSGNRLLQTLNSVLDLAQLEAGALHLELERIGLVDEARQVVEQFQPQAQEKGLALRLDAPDSGVVGRVDRAAFLRVMTNLVSNAIKFTEEGQVTVTLGQTDTAIEVRVADTGIGISDDFLDTIFDEFRQESSGASRTHEGSGLGLTITRRLVELMDGTIAVDSTPGAGSTFTVRLPRMEARTDGGGG